MRVFFRVIYLVSALLFVQLFVQLLVEDAYSAAPAATKGKLKTAPALKSKVAVKSKKKKIDYNAIGAAFMQKKNFPEALRNFNLAVTNEPKNPLSMINRARALIEINISTEPVDYCDYARNWIFDVLTSLSTALDINRTKTAALLASIKDPGFAKFRQRPEYKKWMLLMRLPLKTDAATQEFFAKHNDWLIPKQPMPATIVTFAPNHDLTIASAEGGREVGSWTAGADRVVIKQGANLKTMNLTTFNYQYDAKRSFKQVVLKDQNGSEQWLMGPEIADCPN